jgi:peptidoglycan/LPS O-acetylase OafA/YrhL
MIPDAPAKAGADGIKATKPAAKFHMRWLVLVSAAVVLALGLVLLFLLTQATDNRQLYERNYQLLFGLNMVVALISRNILIQLKLIRRMLVNSR